MRYSYYLFTALFLPDSKLRRCRPYMDFASESYTKRGRDLTTLVDSSNSSVHLATFVIALLLGIARTRHDDSLIIMIPSPPLGFRLHLSLPSSSLPVGISSSQECVTVNSSQKNAKLTFLSCIKLKLPH
jgi:hypothetical protein